MGELRRTHSIEFKQKAVDMYLKEGKGYQTVAKELGIRHSTVQLWVKRFREEDVIIAELSAQYSVSLLCRLARVSRSVTTNGTNVKGR